MTFEVDGYELDAERFYDPKFHMWVVLLADGRAHIGLDPLGVETSGDVVALSLKAPATTVGRGESFGDLEAAKFVGPLICPVSGVITSANAAVLADPGLLNEDPAMHWLAEIALGPATASELDELLRGEEQVRPWFAAEVKRFRTQGAIAE